MTKKVYRLMPPFGSKFSVEQFEWTDPVEGVQLAIPLTHLDFVAVFVDGQLLFEGRHYERFVSGNDRAILFHDCFQAPRDGWAEIRVYRRAGEEQGK